MIIQPWNDTEITMANQSLSDFPALQHFWKIDTTDSSSADTTANTITDAVSGAVITFTELTSGAVGAVAPGTVSNFSGTLASPGSSDVLVIVTGSFGTGGIGFGMTDAATGKGYWLAGSTGNTAISDGIPDAADCTWGTGVKMRALYGDFAGNITARSMTGETLATEATWASTNVATINAINQTITVEANVVNISGIAIFHFTTSLTATQIEAGITWMQDQWVTNKNKVIYPGYAGLT